MTAYFPAPPPNPEAALRDLKSAKPAVRRAAAEALGDVLDEALHDRIRAALITATEDLHPDVRAAAALSLGEVGGQGACAALMRCLDDGNPAVRQSAAVALGALGDKAAVPALIDALGSGPPDLRFQAATSLAEIDPEAAREPLLAALGDDDAEVVGAAALALGVIGEKRASPRLAALIGEHGPRTAFDLAYALADLGDPRAAAILASYVVDDGYGWDAIVSLEKLAGDEAAVALASVLGRPRVNPVLRLRAAGALLRREGVNPDPARRELIAGLASRKLEHRGLAVELLGELGGEWARPALERLRGKWSGRRLRDEIDAALAQLAERGL